MQRIGLRTKEARSKRDKSSHSRGKARVSKEWINSTKEWINSTNDKWITIGKSLIY
jgi:hypothetical protein